MRSRWRFPLCFALVAAGFAAVAHLALAPTHVRTGGAVTAWVGAVVRLLELPGLFVAETGGDRFRHQPEGWTWAFVVSASFPFHVAFAYYLRRLWSGGGDKPAADRVPVPTPAPADDPAPPRSIEPPSPDGAVSRRGFLILARRATVAGVAGVGAYSVFGAPADVEVTRRSFPVRDLPEPLRGLRVVQLTDIHHGPWTSLAQVRDIVDRTNALRPDLVLLTGDYVHDSPEFITPVVTELAKLRASIGVVGTLGNHDWWEDGVATMRAFHAVGIPLVDNNRLFVTGDRTLTKEVGHSDRRHALCVAGAGDLWEGEPNYQSALYDLPREMPRILMAHNPDTAEHARLLKYNPRIDLMLSGHTHGGQVSLPLVGPPVTLSRYGRKYASGLVQGPICPVYVSRGLGTTVAPVRFGVRPEIAVIELVGA
ncbi:MAG TPA: metallophosphoesterase [Humisphaera sp.]